MEDTNFRILKPYGSKAQICSKTEVNRNKFMVSNTIKRNVHRKFQKCLKLLS